MKFPAYKALMLSLVVMSGVAAGAEKASSQKSTALMLFRTADTNRDGKISEEEYVGQTSGKDRKNAKQEFRSRDYNGDGWLSAKEHSEDMPRSRFP
jgi:Ca2+-binding EF-hand superfamily protein